MRAFKSIALIVGGALLAVGVVLMFLPNNKAINKISYCSIDNRDWRTGATIDLEKMRFYGSDVSAVIRPIKYGNLIGFDMPFPMLLFDASVDRSQLKGEIISGDYKFRYFPADADVAHSDWWLISATINKNNAKFDQQAPHTNAKILYSEKDGLLAVSLFSDFGVINLVPCTNTTLKYKDFKEALNKVSGDSASSTHAAE